MRVLLTGSTGFIGKAVAAALRARGDLVVPVVRSAPATGEVGVDLAAGRLDTSKLPGGSLEGIDASVHLAGAPIVGRWTQSRREQIRSSRVVLGELVARSLTVLERKPNVHVTGSAIGYYGNRGEEVLDETSEPGVGFLADICRHWEAAATPATAAGIRTAAVRTGIVLGKGGALSPQLPLFKLGLGGKLGSGQQWMSWISLEDEVRAILFALDEPSVSGPLDLTAPNPVRNAEFTATLAKALHRPAVLTVPASALRLALGSEPADEMLLASQRVLPRRLMDAGFQHTHPQLSDALAAIA